MLLYDIEKQLELINSYHTELKDFKSWYDELTRDDRTDVLMDVNHPDHPRFYKCMAEVAVKGDIVSELSSAYYGVAISKNTDPIVFFTLLDPVLFKLSGMIELLKRQLFRAIQQLKDMQDTFKETIVTVNQDIENKIKILKTLN